MNKNTKKLHNKYYRHDKKKHTNRKKKVNVIKIENRFKNLNAKTVKELQNKFRRERLYFKNKTIVNREQIGCSNRAQIGCSNNMTGGSSYSSIFSDVFNTLEDYGTSTYNSVYGYPQVPSSDAIDQPYLAERINL
jgi:hypothetical protein